jgi:hypothetical protein
VRVRFIPFMFLLATMPAVVVAQPGRGGRSGNDGKPDKYAPTNDLPSYPGAAAIQKFNPVAMLIDQRKKIPLSDSTVALLGALRSVVYERNADLMARYDSVQRIYKPENANDASSLKADSVRTRSLQQTLVMNAALDSMMTRRQNDDLDALALISDDKQKKKAADLLDKQDADFAKLLPAGALHSGRRRR